MPPTDKQVRVSGINIEHIVDGKIVEWWHYFDMLGWLQQLGVIPDGVGSKIERNSPKVHKQVSLVTMRSAYARQPYGPAASARSSTATSPAPPA